MHVNYLNYWTYASAGYNNDVVNFLTLWQVGNIDIQKKDLNVTMQDLIKKNY